MPQDNSVLTAFNLWAAPNYEWVLIKDSDVTKALQDIININGEITGIKNFNVEVSSWKTDTSEELSSLKKRTTTIETDYSTKQDVTDKINGIQVGGTNMLLWTTTMPGKFSTDSSGASSKGTVSYQSDGSALVTNNNSNFRFQYHPDVSVMIGSTYVVSAYYKDVSGTQEHQFQVKIDKRSLVSLWYINDAAIEKFAKCLVDAINMAKKWLDKTEGEFMLDPDYYGIIW